MRTPFNWVSLSAALLIIAGFGAIPGSGVEKSSFWAHPKRSVFRVVFSKDGDRLITTGGDWELKVWRLKDQICLQRFQFQGNAPAIDAQFSAEGDSIWMLANSLGGFDTPIGWQVYLGNVKTGEKSLRYSGSKEKAVQLWAETKTVVSVGKDGETGACYFIRLTHLGTENSSVLRFAEPVGDPVFSKDRKLVALTGSKNNVRIVDISQGKIVASVAAVDFGRRRCIFSPDKRALITIDGNAADERCGEVSFWDISKREKKYTRTMRTVFELLPDYSGDGRLLTVLDTTCIFFFDFKAEHFLDAYHCIGSESKLRCLQFSPDGRTIAAGDDYGSVRIFDFPKEEQK